MRLLKIKTIIILFYLAFCASSELDIDYRHSIEGEGTVVTDYKMITQQNSEASGMVRGSGEFINRYIFQSGNESQNLTLEDEFIFSRFKTATLPFTSFPKISEAPTWFRLAGTSWARNITVLGYRDDKQ
jgi:hypothetical protein